jgi:transposase
MDIHKNARLTFRSREALVAAIAAGMCCHRASAVFRVTPKTAAKWRNRFQSEGRTGLLDRSSRPRRSPRATSSHLTSRVIDLRRQHQPAYHIARSTGLSPATVSRILRRAHLNRWRDLHPAPPIVRYEHPFPGDLLHLDIKGMTRYQQVSIRGDGRRRERPKFAGWKLSISPSMTTPAWRSRAYCPTSEATPPLPSCKMPWPFMLSTASAFAACSPITEVAIALASSVAPAPNSASVTALLVPTLPALTARQSDSFRPLCVSGLTLATGPTPRSETNSSSPGCSITTSPGLMVVSTTLHLSAASFLLVQPLD